MPRMNGAAGHLRQDARMVMHDDEHAILKEILCKALGDDAYFRRLVSSDRSESGRVEHRLVLARFLDRMERHFALRAEALASTNGERGADALSGDSPWRESDRGVAGADEG